MGTFEPQTGSYEIEKKQNKVELDCLYCGKNHLFSEDSNQAKGIFNVFCNGDCEDKYSFNL